MKKLIVLGAALMALAACADSPPVPPPAVPLVPPLPAAPPDPPAPVSVPVSVQSCATPSPEYWPCAQSVSGLLP